MSATKHKKALIFFSAGVGDAILLVPLINELKKEGYQITGLFTSVFNCESIFENTVILDYTITKKNKVSLFLFSILHLNHFHKLFLNHFAFSRFNMLCALLLGKAIFSNYSVPNFFKQFSSINFITPKHHTHDALQNALLFNEQLTLNALDFNLNYSSQTKNTFQLPENYIAIQISSANNTAPYKNWPIEKWLEFFSHLKTVYPHTTLILLGDHNELYLNKKLKFVENPHIISLIGKTSLNDAMGIINQSQFYIGLDSGLMHIAVALNKPTFTIWGGSNPLLYGYEWLSNKHKCVCLYLPCAPCSAWMRPNTTRVKNPNECPDFKCIKELPVSKVIQDFENFTLQIGLK